jgi:hypothetical protein
MPCCARAPRLLRVEVGEADMSVMRRMVSTIAEADLRYRGGSPPVD